MRVAYPMRVDALDKPGGDVLQVMRYIEEGKKPDADGQPRFEGSILGTLSADLSCFDLVHLTNIDRPVDTYPSFIAANAAHKPILISPIHHSYEEIERYERLGRDGGVSAISGMLTFQQLEYLRSMVRSFEYPVLASAVLRMTLSGMRKAQREVLTGARRILVLGEKEKNDILHDFGEIPEERFVTLRSGFESFADGLATSPSRDIEVCVVGRIEARKNQVSILRVLNRIGVSGVFVGGENPKHMRYCQRFRELISKSRSRYLGQLSHEKTLALMSRARLHVSASWFEVSSLVDLEAYGAGCGIVSSQCGGTREILGDAAEYVDPGSEKSIEDGIDRMLARVKRGNSEWGEQGPQASMLNTWSKVGDELEQIYREALDAHRRGLTQA